MVKITKLPPGKASGADDLQIWARRRNGGLSGVPDDCQQKNRHIQKRPKRARLLRLLRELTGDQWLFRLIGAGRKLGPEDKQLAVHLLETLVHHAQVHKTNEQLGQ